MIFVADPANTATYTTEIHTTIQKILGTLLLDFVAYYY